MCRSLCHRARAVRGVSTDLVVHDPFISQCTFQNGPIEECDIAGPVEFDLWMQQEQPIHFARVALFVYVARRSCFSTVLKRIAHSPPVGSLTMRHRDDHEVRVHDLLARDLREFEHHASHASNRARRPSMWWMPFAGSSTLRCWMMKMSSDRREIVSIGSWSRCGCSP